MNQFVVVDRTVVRSCAEKIEGVARLYNGNLRVSAVPSQQLHGRRRSCNTHVAK